MKKVNSAAVSILFFFVLLTNIVSAHPGRTDASGCHMCRTNCPDWGLSIGEYHCHNAKALPQPEEPIRSHYGADGAGTTEPWPEYEAPATVAASKDETIKNIEPITSVNGPVVTEEKTHWFIRFLKFIF